MEQQIIANGELQYIPQIAVQYVNLDFDGELTSYNGGILTVEDIAVSADTLTSESSAYEYSLISKNFSTVVSFFDKGTNQTIMATVKWAEGIEYVSGLLGKRVHGSLLWREERAHRGEA